MKILHLSLKGEWFRMIESGEKTEEYRAINKYWNRRLHRCLTDAPGKYGDCQSIINEMVINDCPCHKCDHSEDIEFTHALFRLGYTKETMLYEIKKISKGIGNPNLGAPDHEVFIIKLGDKIYE